MAIICHFSWMPKVFPGFQQLCHTSPSKYPHSGQPQSSPWSLKPEHEHPTQASKPLLCWEVLLRTDICSEFYPFCLCTPVAALPSQVLKLSLTPSLRGFPTVQKPFFLQDSLPQVQIIPWNYLSLLLSLPFTLPHSEEIFLPFWKAESSSASVQVFCRTFSIYS